MSRCKSCGAAIVWLVTRNGKRCPADLIGRDGKEVGDREQYSRAAHISHWETCPTADQHRQKKGEQRVLAAQPRILAVTLLQPWPWIISHLHCRVITMGGYAPCPPGTHLALHAALGWCRVGERLAQQRRGEVPELPRGAIVAVARYAGLAEEGRAGVGCHMRCSVGVGSVASSCPPTIYSGGTPICDRFPAKIRAAVDYFWRRSIVAPCLASSAATPTFSTAARAGAATSPAAPAWPGPSRPTPPNWPAHRRRCGGPL